MSSEDIRLGKLLATWRTSAGLSQAAIAERLSIQQSTVSKLEAGSCKLSVTQLVSFLHACGLDLPQVSTEITDALSTYNLPLWERSDD